MTSRSVAHTAIASMRTSTSAAPGWGTGFPTSLSSPGLASTQDFIFSGITEFLRRVSESAAKRVVAAHVIVIGLRRIAVDERPRIERITQAAHLVLDREQQLAAVQVNDVAEAILVFIAFFGNQAACSEEAMRPRKIREINLDVVAVIGRQRACGFAKQKLLGGAGIHPGNRIAAALLYRRDCAQGLAVKTRDPVGGAARHLELDIRKREVGRAEFGARRVATEAVAPRTGRLDAVGVRLKTELRVLEPGRDFFQALRKLAEIGHHDADGAAQTLRVAVRQVTLAAADVDPHVIQPDLHIRVARKPHARDVKRGRGHGVY